MKTSFAGAVAALVALAAACSNESPIAQRCHDIPANGCPAIDGACQDPTCAATYACNDDGTWSFVASCNHPDGGGGSGSGDGATNASDAGAGFDVNGIDAPPGANGEGCTPLEGTDCPLAVALGCAASGGSDPCCGCEELFVCSNGGWNLWGSCFDDGGIQQAAP
jgi:hypothetical protein